MATADESARDSVTLSSGNRLLGEIRELDRGTLAFAIDGAGTVDIDWNNVETLAGSVPLDIELVSGERLSGMVTSPTPRTIEIAVSSGTRAVAMGGVVRMYPVGADIRARTSGNLDLGFDVLGANNEVDLTFHGEISNRTHRYLTAASFDSLLRRLDGVTAQRRNRLDVNSRRFLRDRWFVLGDALLEENRELGLDSRLLVALAAGRMLVQSNRAVLSLYGGLAYDIERYRDVAGTARSPEALGAVEFDWFKGGGRTELSTQARLYLDLDRHRERAEVILHLRRQLARSYYWSLALYESYDSAPPAGFANDDQGLNVTIGRSF